MARSKLAPRASRTSALAVPPTRPRGSRPRGPRRALRYSRSVQLSGKPREGASYPAISPASVQSAEERLHVLIVERLTVASRVCSMRPPRRRMPRSCKGDHSKRRCEHSPRTVQPSRSHGSPDSDGCFTVHALHTQSPRSRWYAQQGALVARPLVRLQGRVSYSRPRSANIAQRSARRQEKPYSLSYQPIVFDILPPSSSMVAGRSKIAEPGWLRKSLETSWSCST